MDGSGDGGGAGGGEEVRYRLDRYRSSEDMATATFTHVHTSAPDVFAAPRGMH